LRKSGSVSDIKLYYWFRDDVGVIADHIPSEVSMSTEWWVGKILEEGGHNYPGLLFFEPCIFNDVDQNKPTKCTN